MVKIKLSKPEKKLDKPTIPVWDLIKQKLTIGEQITIKGNRGLCLISPNSENPALYYNENDDTVYCHRCKRPLDSIGVYAALNNLDYREAVKILAERFKIEFGMYDKKQLDTRKEIDNLFIKFTKKCKINLKELNKPLYESIKKRRGFTDDIMEMFKIGLFDDLTKTYMEKKYSTKLLRHAGFVFKKGLEWNFGKRIVYPYLDHNNNPKYFIYRLIDKEPDNYPNSKYRKQMNTNYVKELPFGLNSLKLHRNKTLIITEGITDAISVIMAGYPCLSPVTTQIKKSDIEKMVNYCKRAKKIVVINDNEEFKKNKAGELDNSGLKGSIITLKILIEHNLEPYISIIPNPEKLEKIDLDDYLQPANKANEKLTTLITNATFGIDFLIKNEDVPIKDILEIIQTLPPIKKEDIINKINKERKIGKRTLNAEMKVVNETESKRVRRETEKKLKKNIDDLSLKIKMIPFDDGRGSMIQIREKNIYLVTSQITKNNKIKTTEEKIFDGKLLFDKKTIDYQSGEKILYSFWRNLTYHTTLSFQEFMGRFEEKIRKSKGLGRDVMKEVFNFEDKKLKEYKAEYICGWNNGWKIPQLEQENAYTIITRTDFQKESYNKIKKSIKEYSKEEKEKITKKIKEFFKLTQTDDLKLAIIIGWCMAAPFKLFFLERFNLFPHLYLYGLPNTGKTSLAKFFTSKWYKISDPLSSYTTESISQLEDHLSTCTFPLFISEVAEVKNPRILATLKDSATGVSDFTRKNPDGSTKYKKPKVAAICLDSNYSLREMTDSAFNTKIIFLKFDVEDIINDDQNWVKLSRSLNREKLFSFMYDYTKDWTNKDIHKRLDSNQEKQENINKFFPRLNKIWQIIKFGLKLFTDMLDITMPIDEMGLLELLKGERKEAVKSLKDWFYEFLIIAKDFEEDYQDEAQDKAGNTYYIPRRGNNPPYLTQPLIEKDDYYGFTNKNLRDFKLFSGKRNLSLNSLANNLRQSTGEKEYITKGTIWYDGKTYHGIKINKKFIKE